MTLSAGTLRVRTGTAFTVPEGTSQTRVRLFDTSATIVHRTDEVEHERRRQQAVGHLASMELLDVLLDLPAGVAVPLSSVDSSRVRVLRRAQGGVVRVTPRSVMRLVEPVVVPVLAVVYAARWRDGLVRASRFAAYLPRMVVVRDLPGDAEMAIAEASWYGIGVAVGPRSTPTTVLEPEPLWDWQPTVAWWHFCERVYRHVLDGGDSGLV